MPEVRPAITFRLFKGDQLLREERLSLQVIKIGKVSSSHLRIDDDSVSRMHAVIEVTSASDVSIIDLGSTRGTFVNDQKINKAKLQSGDVVTIGDVRVEVALAVAEAAAPVPVAVAVPVPVPVPVPPPIPAPMIAAVPVPVPAPVAEALTDGARAIEVATMLGDSVVGVKHCMNPRSTGKPRPATYGILAGGAALVVVAMIWFAMGVRNASFNEAKLKHWTRPVAEGGLGKPTHAFRPRMLTSNPALYDGITFGGLLGGLVLLAWGVARVRDERRSPYFRVDDHPLVAPRGDDFVLRLAAGMHAEPAVTGEQTLAPGARVRVKHGQTTYLVSSVAVPRRHPVPVFAGVEANVMAYFAGSAVFFLGIWALLRTVHGGLDTANGDDDSSELAMVNAETEGHETPPPDEPVDDVDTGEAADGAGHAMALTEGKAGKTESDQAEGRIKVKANGEPQLARAQAIAAAKVAGILGSEAFASGAAFSSLTGTGDISSGLDDSDIYGGFLGDQAGEMQGGFGWGQSGFGPGGGGDGWGTYGTGKYGTIGGGGGAGDGYGLGGGGKCTGATCGRRKPAVPAIRIGAPQGSGDLDKATIRRYIKRNLAKIKYCYEKELLATPGLAGTVDTQFLINPNGTVGEVHAKGVNGDVSSCVATVIKGIAFPKPKGGAPVNVTSYPFEFHPSGG